MAPPDSLSFTQFTPLHSVLCSPACRLCTQTGREKFGTTACSAERPCFVPRSGEGLQGLGLEHRVAAGTQPLLPFSNSSTNFPQLYNYPKDDLKAITNDQYFKKENNIEEINSQANSFQSSFFMSRQKYAQSSYLKHY